MTKTLPFLTIAYFLFCTSILHAQVFNTLVQDAQDTPSVKDIRLLSYAIDETNDSLWIRLSYYDTIGGDFGSALGFDTNMNVNDGVNWGGSNTSMKCDTIIYLERNGFFETNIRSSSLLVKSIVETDSTLTLNFQLSELSSSGKFNLLAGAGFFDISSTGTIMDDVPDTGYVTVPESTPTSIKTHETIAWKIYPNPASNLLTISASGTPSSQNGSIELVSLDGRLLQKWNAIYPNH